jgi:hypothetical protein
MPDCRHNGQINFTHHEVKAGDLLMHFECQECGVDGWFQLDTDQIDWETSLEEDAHECDETCAIHMAECGGRCDHVGGKNACVEACRGGPHNNINNCLIAFAGREVHPDYGPCQMCNGTCPDKERLNARND